MNIHIGRAISEPVFLRLKKHQAGQLLYLVVALFVFIHARANKVRTLSLSPLLGNPKDFDPWDFFMEPGSSLTRRRKKSQNLRSGLGLPSKQPP
jgi:hypothetical protein